MTYIVNRAGFAKLWTIGRFSGGGSTKIGQRRIILLSRIEQKTSMKEAPDATRLPRVG